MTADELITKVKERIDATRLPNEPPQDVLEATCWFISFQIAMEVFDSYTSKDLARIIQDGSSIAGPFRTIYDITQWIEDVEGAGDQGDTWEWLDEALDRHFGSRGVHR